LLIIILAHDEIEAILARYRNKPENQSATTTTTTANTKVDYYSALPSNSVPTAADVTKTTTTTTSVNV